MKKHNLFEDNLALPSESVSSLTDLKTPPGSNQASPARLSALVPSGVPDGESPSSSEVFQEAEAQQQRPGAEGEGLSSPGPSPRPGGDEQVLSGLAAEDTAGAPSASSPELNVGKPPGDQEPSPEKPASVPASGTLKELRELLTVTVEVPAESAPGIGTDTSATLVPQENEKEEEKPHISADGSPAAAPQDSSEESPMGEREAHPPLPEAEAPGVDAGAFPEASSPASQPASGEFGQDARCPGSADGPAEAAEPPEREPAAGTSALEAREGEAVSQEGDTVGSDPGCPGESQVSEEGGAMGGGSCTAPAVGSVEVKAAHVHECQWVVETAPDTQECEACQESAPEQPSEE